MMAINTLFQLSAILRPGLYGVPKQMYGNIVGEREDMHHADCIRTAALLESFKRLDIVWDVTFKGRRSKENDNEIYYKLTIWEPIREFN